MGEVHCSAATSSKYSSSSCSKVCNLLAAEETEMKGLWGGNVRFLLISSDGWGAAILSYYCRHVELIFWGGGK